MKTRVALVLLALFGPAVAGFAQVDTLRYYQESPTRLILWRDGATHVAQATRTQTPTTDAWIVDGESRKDTAWVAYWQKVIPHLARAGISDDNVWFGALMDFSSGKLAEVAKETQPYLRISLLRGARQDTVWWVTRRPAFPADVETLDFTRKNGLWATTTASTIPEKIGIQNPDPPNLARQAALDRIFGVVPASMEKTWPRRLNLAMQRWMTSQQDRYYMYPDQAGIGRLVIVERPRLRTRKASLDIPWLWVVSSLVLGFGLGALILYGFRQSINPRPRRRPKPKPSPKNVAGAKDYSAQFNAIDEKINVSEGELKKTSESLGKTQERLSETKELLAKIQEEIPKVAQFETLQQSQATLEREKEEYEQVVEDQNEVIGNLRARLETLKKSKALIKSLKLMKERYELRKEKKGHLSAINKYQPLAEKYNRVEKELQKVKPISLDKSGKKNGQSKQGKDLVVQEHINKLIWLANTYGENLARIDEHLKNLIGLDQEIITSSLRLNEKKNTHGVSTEALARYVLVLRSEFLWLLGLLAHDKALKESMLKNMESIAGVTRGFEGAGKLLKTLKDDDPSIILDEKGELATTQNLYNATDLFQRIIYELTGGNERIDIDYYVHPDHPPVRPVR